MANNNKVLYNVDQRADTTDVEKAQARANIGASDGTISWVTYNEGSPTPIVDNSTLAVVQSDSGARIQNADASTKYYVAPDTTSSDKGKFFGVNSYGTATWQNVPNPPQDVFMESQLFDESSYGGNIQPIKAISCPTHNGKYPTKIIGSFYCNPQTDYDSISVIPLVSAYVSGGEFDFKFYENSQNVNVQNLLALTDSSDTRYGQYSNTITFQFHKNPRFANGEIAYIGLKGESGSTESNYNPHNINLTFFYESDDNANNQ